MKRFAYFAALAALACGAQVASAQQSDEGTLNVAQVAAPGDGYEAPRRAQPLNSGRNMLIELGFSPGDGFPQRGGLIDD